MLHTTSALAIGAVALAAALPAAAQDDPVAAAKAYVEQVTKPNPPWDGPTTGPAAQPGKTIVYASADQRNGGALGVGLGVEEAAKLLGWNFHLIDGRASVSGRSEALNQAIARAPGPLQHASAPLLLGAVTDRGQLAQVDYWLARTVVRAVTGDAGVKALRQVPYRRVREEWGLVSLEHARNTRA